MAGRKPRLWDFQTNLWVYFDSDEERDKVYNSTDNQYQDLSTRTRIGSSNEENKYKGIRRYWDEGSVMNLLASRINPKFSLKTLNPTTFNYSPLSSTINPSNTSFQTSIDNRLNDLQISEDNEDGRELYGAVNDFFDKNPNATAYPESWGLSPYRNREVKDLQDLKELLPEPTYRLGGLYQDRSTGKYFRVDKEGQRVYDIPENKIGSDERRALQALDVRGDEGENSWLSEYYTFLQGGYDAMSQEAKEVYSDTYFEKDEELRASNSSYNSTAPHIIKGRALRHVAGALAINKYLDEMEVPLDSPLRLLEGMSNTDLAQLSERNYAVGELFNEMMDHYLLDYYKGVYEDVNAHLPETLTQEIKQDDYESLNEFLADPDAIHTAIEDTWGEGIAKKGSLGNKAISTVSTLFASIGNKMYNLWGPLMIRAFLSEKIENSQRDRAKSVIDQISAKLATNNINRLNELKADPALYKKTLESLGYSEEKFDKIALAYYPYYNEHDLLELTPDLKRDAYITLVTESQALGDEMAGKRFIEKLLNTDYTNLGTVTRVWNAGNNLVNTINTTLMNITNIALHLNPYTWASGLLHAGYDAVFEDSNFWDNLGDNIVEGWRETVNSDLANYAAEVSATGAWLPSELKRLGDLGILANPILRRYGEEDTFWTASTAYDIVPVAGYMIGSSAGSYGINLVSNIFKGTGRLLSTASLASRASQMSAVGNMARFYSAASKTTKWSSKFLKANAKLLDAAAPSIATTGMDFGYAKDNYDSAVRLAMDFLYTTDEAGNLTYTDKFYRWASAKADREILAKHDADRERIKAETEGKGDIVINPELDAQVKDALIKKYADEYLEEAKLVALENAALTFGLTIIPDVSLANTWKKAMFSATSRGALADILNSIRRTFNVKPKLSESLISDVLKTEAGWKVGTKKFTKKDLIKLYGKLLAGGFVSNYLQDVGVAAGLGWYENKMKLYLDQRFNSEANDSISFDLDLVILASTASAGRAFTEWTSFRDGLYGALAPLIANPHINLKGTYTQGVGKNKTMSLPKAIWKNLSMNSIAYNMTFGAKDIVSAENIRREKLATTVENWLNTKGSTFLEHIGGFIDLSNLEKAAIKENDFSSFLKSRMGQMIETAAMLLQLSSSSPHVRLTKQYMEERADREDVTLEDIDVLHLLAIEIDQDIRDLTLKLIDENRKRPIEQQMTLEEILKEARRQVLENVDPNTQGLMRDLTEIQLYSQDSKVKDSRTEVLKLNDLRDNAREMLSMMDDLLLYMSEAEATFGDIADPTVKQIYAQVKAYLKTLERKVDELTSLLNDINSKMKFRGKNRKSTLPLDLSEESLIALAEFGGNTDKILEEILKNTQAILSNKEIIKQLKEQKREAKTSEEKEAIDMMINMYETLLAPLESRNKDLATAISEWNSLSEESESKHPFISANDMASLSEENLLKLLTSEHLSAKQKEQVTKFLKAAEAVNPDQATKGSYTEILKSKLDNLTLIQLASLAEGFDSKGIQLLNQAVADRRKLLARDFYKKSFESMVDESLYYLTEESQRPGASKLYHNDDLLAYEAFVKRYQEREEEILARDNAGEILLGLHEALKDNKFYKMYSKLLLEVKKIKGDINKYVDPAKFSERERAELLDIIDFAVVIKNMEEDKVLETLSNADSKTLNQLKKYLDDRGHTTGSIEDIKERLLIYNHNIVDTIAANKAAAEKRKNPKGSKQLTEEAKDKRKLRNLVNTINTLVSYTSAEQDSNFSTMRKLMDILGVKDASNISRYTNEVVLAAKDIIEAVTEESDLKSMIEKIDSEISGYTQGLDGRAKLSGESQAALITLTEFLKLALRTTSGKLVPYKAPVSKGTTSATVGTSSPSTVSLTKLLHSSIPYLFADLSLHPDNPLLQLLEKHNPQEFLRTVGIPRGTLIVFISSSEWARQIKDLMGEENYNEADALPIFGAVKVQNATDTTIPIETETKDADGNPIVEHYLILGIMPATNKVANTAIIRSSALGKTVTDSKPYIIKDNLGQVLSTPIESNPHSSIDTDAEPTPVQVEGKLITANLFLVDRGEDGKITNVRVNQTPGSNDTARDRANWSYVLVLEVDLTTNDKEETIDKVEDATLFNSRTEGFTTTLLNILEVLSKNKANIKRVLLLMSSSSMGEDHNINKRIENADNTALGLFITLQNGYAFALALDKNNNIVLTVGKATDKGVTATKFDSNNTWVIANNESLNSDTKESVTPIDTIIKELAALKDTEGNSIAKWQVSFGNFDNLSTGFDLKQSYIKQAVKDRILYVQPVKTKFDILITPVLDSAMKELIRLDNAARELLAAQERLNKAVNPVTGDANDANNTGETLSSLLQIVKKSSSIAENILNAVINALAKLQLIKAKVDSFSAGKPKLAINEHKQRKSSTGTSTLGKANDNELSKADVCRFVNGTCVDIAVRDFFNPELAGQMKDHQYFKELFKDVFNDITCKNLYNALVDLNETFRMNGWSVISNGIYTIDEELNNKLVGEVDLLVLDSLGNFHIIDIKTYSNRSSFINSLTGDYARNASLYRNDMLRNLQIHIPEKNLHIFALNIDNSADYYTMKLREDSNGNTISTITKDKRKLSVIQIKAEARFEQFNSESVPAFSYIGDEKTTEFIDKRRGKILDINSEDAEKGELGEDGNSNEPLGEEPVNEDNIPDDDGEDDSATVNSYRTFKGTDELNNEQCGH